MVEALGEAREELLAILYEGDETGLSQKIADWADRHKDNTQVRNLLWHPMVKAELGGGMFVFDVELQNKLDAAHRLQDIPDKTPFLNMPFTDAIDFAIDRGQVSEETLADLDGRWRGRSVEASEAMFRTIQKRTENAVERALRQGRTLTQFADEVQQASAGLGLGFRDTDYLETIFRTSVQSAYGAGRFRAMKSEAVIDGRPFAQYRAVLDGATRPSHEDLHGTTYRTGSSSWNAIAPPNGFNCRCGMVTRAEDEVDPRTVRDEPPQGAGADDPRFDMSPIAQVEMPIAA